MKMSKESYTQLLAMFTEKRQVLRQHMAYIQRNERYNSLEVRLGYDAIYSFMPKNWIVDLYRTEDLNDKHMVTAIKRAVKEADITPIELEVTK